MCVCTPHPLTDDYTHIHANFYMWTCVSAIISECHQGRGPAVVWDWGGTCITFIDSQSFLKNCLGIGIERGSGGQIPLDLCSKQTWVGSVFWSSLQSLIYSINSAECHGACVHILLWNVKIFQVWFWLCTTRLFFISSLPQFLQDFMQPWADFWKY